MGNVLTTGELPPVPTSDYSDWPCVMTTQGEFGQQLPIGILQNQMLHRQFSFKRYNSRVERELDEERRKQKNLNAIDWATIVLARLLTRLGPYTAFEQLSEQERRQVIYNCATQDVMYMLICLRSQAMGPEVRFNLTCQQCGHEWRPSIDLGEIPIRATTTIDQLARVYTLREPIEFGNGKTYTKLVVDQPKWSALAGFKSKSFVSAEFQTLIGAIRYAFGETDDVPPLPASEAFLDEFGKYDFEHLRALLDEKSLGPDMALSADCPECSKTNKYGLDWSWDFFFKSPSL